MAGAPCGPGVGSPSSCCHTTLHGLPHGVVAEDSPDIHCEDNSTSIDEADSAPLGVLPRDRLDRRGSEDPPGTGIPTESSIPGEIKTGRAHGLRLLAHALLVLSLAACDGLRQLDQDGPVELALALVALYVVLLGMLVALHLAGTLQGKPRQPPWLVLAGLHAGLSIASARWQWGSEEYERSGRDVASLLGILQLSTAVLYPVSLPASAITSAVSLLALMVHELTLPGDLFEGRLVCGTVMVMAAGCSCAAGARGGEDLSSRSIRQELLNGCISRGCGDCDNEVLKFNRSARASAEELRNVLRPLLDLGRPEPLGGGQKPKVSTGLEHLVAQLQLATSNARGSRNLEPEVVTIVSQALRAVLKELRSPPALERITSRSLTGSSRNIVRYVNAVLQPPPVTGGQIHDVPELPRCSDSLPHSETGLSSFSASACWSCATQRSLRSRSNTRNNTAGSAAGGDRSAKSGSLLKEEPPPDEEMNFARVVADMTETFSRRRELPRAPDELSGSALSMLSGQLGTWGFDVFAFAERCGSHYLSVLGKTALRREAELLGVDFGRLGTCLESIEERYSEVLPYHNALHGADVMNSMLYFLNLPLEDSCGCSLDCLERLTSLVVASAHDIGHMGQSNIFHTSLQTPLAVLFNDQSVLENMHCALLFMVMSVEGANFMECTDSSEKADFRSLAIPMILSTDLSKHVKLVSQFRQEFVDMGGGGQKRLLAQPQRRELLSYLLKCADTGGSAKSFYLHSHWTLRINTELYSQGDMETSLGVPCSPFCDRREACLSESQHGFFDFVVEPMLSVLQEFVRSPELQLEVLNNVTSNHAFWQLFDAQGFDYADPLSNLDVLRAAHQRLYPEQYPDRTEERAEEDQVSSVILLK